MDKPSVIGAVVGFVLSILFMIFHWTTVLFIFGLTVVGYLLGRYIESKEEVQGKLRELLSVLFR